MLDPEPGLEALAAQVGGLPLPEALTSAQLSGKSWGAGPGPSATGVGVCCLHLWLGVLGSGSRGTLQGDTCGDKSFPENSPNRHLWGFPREEPQDSKAVFFSYFGANKSHSPWLFSQVLKSLETLCPDLQGLMAKGIGRGLARGQEPAWCPCQPHHEPGGPAACSRPRAHTLTSTWMPMSVYTCTHALTLMCSYTPTHVCTYLHALTHPWWAQSAHIHTPACIHSRARLEEPGRALFSSASSPCLGHNRCSVALVPWMSMWT